MHLLKGKKGNLNEVGRLHRNNECLNSNTFTYFLLLCDITAWRLSRSYRMVVSELVLQDSKDLGSCESSLLAAPGNGRWCLPLAAQMLKSAGLGRGNRSSQPPSKRSSNTHYCNHQLFCLRSYLSSTCRMNTLQLRPPGFLFQLVATDPPRVWDLWPLGIPGAPGEGTGGVLSLESHPPGLFVFSLSREKLFKMGIYLASCSTCTAPPPDCRRLLRTQVPAH